MCVESFIFNRGFSDCTVHLFGSASTGLCDAKSDVDLCLELSESQIEHLKDEAKTAQEKLVAEQQKEQQHTLGAASGLGESRLQLLELEPSGTLPEVEDVTSALNDASLSENRPAPAAIQSGPTVLWTTIALDKISSSLQASEGLCHSTFVSPLLILSAFDSEFSDVLALPKARVPICKFTLSGVQVDLCIQRLLGVRNSKLIASYLECDHRVAPLCGIIKSWAKQRQISETYKGTLSSYAWTILMINYLQQTTSVFDSLHSLSPKPYAAHLFYHPCS